MKITSVLTIALGGATHDHGWPGGTDPNVQYNTLLEVRSDAGISGIGSSVAYAASKGALNTLTMSLARALGPAVRVNAIAPGLVETPWLQNGMGAEKYAAGVEAYKARTALADIIVPEDIARTAWYLGVDALKTTGEVLLVDAGTKVPPP